MNCNSAGNYAYVKRKVKCLFSFFFPIPVFQPKITERAQQRLQEDSYVHALCFYKIIITSYPKVFLSATVLVHGYMKSPSQQLQHSSSRRKRGKHPTVTDCIYLNSLF